MFQNIENEEERVDKRSVDDLLSFINGGDGDSKGVRAIKNKKKNRKRKDQPRNSSSNNGNGDHKKNDTVDNEASPTKSSKFQDSLPVTFSPNLEFVEDDIDDELDPAMKEKIDREVEDFARRLNSVWPKRVQESVSLGSERLVPMSVYGSGSFNRFNGFGKQQ